MQKTKNKKQTKRKKKIAILIIMIILAVSLIIFFQNASKLPQLSFYSRESNAAGFSSTEIYTSATGAHPVVLVVNSSLYNSISDPSLKQYIADLEAEDYKVIVTTASGGTKEELRSYLKTVKNLEGAVLIGDLPLPYDVAYTVDSSGNVKKACANNLPPDDPACLIYEFLSDYYYMDLNSTYYDFVHKTNSNFEPEIWVSRLSASTLSAKLGQSEAELLIQYFKKNHDYRTGMLTRPYRALQYYEYPFSNSIYYLEKAFDKIRMVPNTLTNSDDYLKRIQGLVDGDYEWFDDCTHGSTTGTSVTSTSENISKVDAHPLFYSQCSCYVGQYTADFYYAGVKIFSPRSSGLAGFFATHVTILQQTEDITKTMGLKSGKNYGEAIKESYNQIVPDYKSYLANNPASVSQWRYEGNGTLIGDGTLRIDPPIARITLVNPANVAQGSAITFSGTGTTINNTIAGYSWRSDKDGILSTASSFSKSNLSVGIHKIYFKVKDSLGHWSSESEASISVGAGMVNNSPVATNQIVTVFQNNPVSFTLGATDADGNPLTYKIQSNPTQGSVLGTLPNLKYTPKSGYAGPDFLTFVANDGKSDSNVAKVDLLVLIENRPPVIKELKNVFFIKENEANVMMIEPADPDGDILTLKLTTPPAHGTVVFQNYATVSFSPQKDYYGKDSFTLVANDGKVDSAPIKVDVIVNQVINGNAVPYSFDQISKMGEGNRFFLTLSSFDSNWDILTYRIVKQPVNGWLFCGTPDHCIYTPRKEFVGTDSFSFVTNDGKNDSNVATVSLELVKSIYTKKYSTTNGQNVTTDQDKPLKITLSGNSQSSCWTEFSIATGPVSGTITGIDQYGEVTYANPSVVTYTPKAGFSGTDSFSIVAMDCSISLSDPATINITVNSTSKDTVAPVLSAGSPAGTLPVGTTQATLSLSTDENATCKYATSANTSYASMTSSLSGAGSKNHSDTIVGLSDGKSYHFYARCQDQSGNANTSDYGISFSIASPAYVQGDLNKDKKVDIFDYSILITNFGTSACGNQADIDGSCKVDIFDFNVMLGNFGK